MKKFTLDFIPYNCPRLFLPIWWIIYLICFVGYVFYWFTYKLIYAVKWIFSPSTRLKLYKNKSKKKGETGGKIIRK